MLIEKRLRLIFEVIVSENTRLKLKEKAMEGQGGEVLLPSFRIQKIKI